jgi:hypothetical protein
LPSQEGDIYHVYIKYSEKKVIDEYPSETNYDWIYTLPANASNISSTTSEKYSDSSSELPNTAFLSNKDTKGNGYYYIGVKLISKLKMNIFEFDY